MKTTHYDNGYGEPSCGRHPGFTAAVSQEAAAVTCGACRNTRAFRERFPELAGEGAGRKPAKGVIPITSKFYLPKEMETWWNERSNKAETVVAALRLLKNKKR